MTSTFCKYRVSFKSLASVSFCCFRSVLGEVYSETPVVLPIRGHLDSIARMMIGDCFFDRGSRQRSLSQSLFCNDFKVAVFGREEAIRRFSLKLLSDNHLRDRLWTLSGLRSVCHCKLTSICHGDVILREFKSMFPDAFDRDDPELSLLLFHCVEIFVRLRDEPPCMQGSSADEGDLPKVLVGEDTESPCQLVWGIFPEKFAMARHDHSEQISRVIFVAFSLSQIHGFFEEARYTGIAQETRSWPSRLVPV